ncbi:unnamed protein product [Alternaria alternata]
MSTRRTYPYLKVATPAASSGTVNEDKAIQHLLYSSLTREQIIDFVRIYKVSKAAGIYGALDIILGIRTDELPKRIHVVEARLTSAEAVISSIPVLETLRTSTKLKREPSENLDEKPDTSLQGAKRVRTAVFEEEPMSKIAPESENVSQATNVRVPAKTHRRGCPGNFWNCQPSELKPRTYWSSFKKFREHYKTHLEDHRVEGHRWQCHLCDHDPFWGNGHDLIQHLYDNHF